MRPNDTQIQDDYIQAYKSFKAKVIAALDKLKKPHQENTPSRGLSNTTRDNLQVSQLTKRKDKL